MRKEHGDLFVGVTKNPDGSPNYDNAARLVRKSERTEGLSQMAGLKYKTLLDRYADREVTREEIKKRLEENLEKALNLIDQAK